MLIFLLLFITSLSWVWVIFNDTFYDTHTVKDTMSKIWWIILQVPAVRLRRECEGVQHLHRGVYPRPAGTHRPGDGCAAQTLQPPAGTHTINTQFVMGGGTNTARLHVFLPEPLRHTQRSITESWVRYIRCPGSWESWLSPKSYLLNINTTSIKFTLPFHWELLFTKVCLSAL